ncbi:ATP-binding protein [Pseudoalteromonas piscicida]|uniref:HD domain-containing protein n=1 Tax=Pseudoalteromonas piscicida TaxID=43662 RepID=UPI001EFC9CCC|nr:ATP-binding protein [Pseudoalteromonas piscicida]MCG9770563.1 ATP-binding protein [Pseudoalteromonas piscicida]
MKIRDSIIELEETKLYAQLSSLDEEYAERIKAFVLEIEPIMASIKNYFPFYTRHDVHHGYQVVHRMEQCLLGSCFDAEQPEALTAQEIFLLIAAAYAHDLGMAIFPGEEVSLRTRLGLIDNDSWETSEALQNYLRKNHSSRGGKYIEQHAESMRVPRNLVTALDLMMKAHNYSIPQLEKELYRPFATGQRESDLAQLAVIVCVADAIEFSDTRVIDGVLEQLSKDQSYAAKISYAENMKHVCTGDSLAVTDDGRIIVSGTFADENVLALAHRTFDQMEEWIQGYSDIDQRAKVKRLKIRGGTFYRDLTLSNGEFHRLGVRLNKRNVIDLIASNAVWRRDQGIAIRELVQNSVEACRYRAHHSAPSDNYCPEVRIVFNRDSHSVLVTDNGCGMSERTVLNNLLTVGSSRSCEVTYTESDYAPIARFGIGFWSVFTISDMATVSTAAFENYRGKPNDALCAQGFKFNVQLEDLKDYTVFSPLERACGTEISLKLKSEVVIDDIYTALKKQLLCSMVPLTIILDGTEEHIEAEVPDVNEELLFGVRRQKANSLGIKVFNYKKSTPQTSIAFGLAYREEDGKATFTATPNNGMHSVMEGHGIHTQRSAVCGFSVPVRVSPFCIDLLRVGTYHANSLTPKGFEFSIDRQQLNSNAAEKRYMDDVRKIFHKGYREFLKSTGSYDAESIHSLQREAASNGGNVYDTFTGSELSISYQNYPDLICNKLIPVDSTSSISDAIKNAKFINLTDLETTEGVVFCLQAQRNRLGGGKFFHLEHPQALELAYAIAQNYIKECHPRIAVYLMEPERNFSMLFDNDPLASARVLSINDELELCLLNIQLGRVNYQDEPTNVLPEIRGRWSGTIYWREFQTPDNKPYLFLGRHRVLIMSGSKLHSYLKELVDGKRFVTIANTVNLLLEDEAGHSPDALDEYI